MSIAKKLHEDRIMTGGYRPLVKRPTRIMWQGGVAWAKCPSCPWAADYQEEHRLPSLCPRCGGRLYFA